MNELPRAEMYVTVGGLDWDGSEVPIHVSTLADRCLIRVGKLSFVCVTNTARRLKEELVNVLD